MTSTSVTGIFALIWFWAKLNPINKIVLKRCADLFFKKLGFTLCKAEQPLQGMELREKKAWKDYSIQEICLERTYS